MKLVLLFCWLFLLLPFWVAAQPTQPARAEIQLDNDFRQFEVWAQPDSSVLVLRIEKPYRRNAVPFALLKYDQDLILKWQYPIELSKVSQYLFGTTFQKTCYLLFEGTKKENYFLARINTVTGQQTITKHELPDGMTFKITAMQAIDGYIFITGLSNSRLVVLHLDPYTGDLQKVPAIYDQSTALSEFQADTLAERVEFILSESNGLKGRLQVKRLAPDGRLYSLNFLQHRDYNYITGRFSPGDSTTKLIAGTYSLRDLRYAQGFYAGPFSPDATQQLQYHDFSTFSHYFDYLKPVRQEKLRRKVARFKVTQKLFQFRHRMLVHTLHPIPEGYLLVGEMYYPHYQNEGTSKGAFDGYLFTEAVVAAVDDRGTLCWQNSFPIQNTKLFELAETISVGQAGKRTILCYRDEDKIWYKEFFASETTPNDKFITIDPPLPSEKIYATYPEGLESWYRNNFLTYGVQTVRGASGLRTVFYLNKIAF